MKVRFTNERAYFRENTAFNSFKNVPKRKQALFRFGKIRDIYYIQKGNLEHLKAPFSIPFLSYLKESMVKLSAPIYYKSNQNPAVELKKS